MPISTEGSGMLTMTPKTGSPDEWGNLEFLMKAQKSENKG